MHMSFIYIFGLLAHKLISFFPLEIKFAQEIYEQLWYMFIYAQWQFTENFAMVFYEAFSIFYYDMTQRAFFLL